MTVKLIVSYDGTDYCGWQVQDHGVSVQQTLEDAVEKISGERVRVTGSGRTDAGVHAQGQVAHFTLSSDNVPPEKFYLALNTVLPNSVKVLSSERAEDGFNARRDAKTKTYRYSFYLSKTIKPLLDRYATQLYLDVDIEKMKDCATLLVGEHDFRGFCSSQTEVKTTVRTIYSLEIDKQGEMLNFTITGSGFLYNMVRIIVGTLIEVGAGRIEKQAIEKMLLTGERSLGGKTYPAKGLCLLKVDY